jgi:hypothetical protein
VIGRRVAYLTLSDSLAIGPELDSGVSIVDKVVSIEALEDTERTVLPLSPETARQIVWEAPLNLWEVLKKCWKPGGPAVLRTSQRGVLRPEAPHISQLTSPLSRAQSVAARFAAGDPA